MRRKKRRRQKTLKTPFLRRAGESCGKILFRRCNLSRRKKLTNNSGIPQHEIENIARILLPDILAFYESEEGQREFAEWKAARDGAKTDKGQKRRERRLTIDIRQIQGIYTPKTAWQRGWQTAIPFCAFIQFS